MIKFPTSVPMLTSFHVGVPKQWKDFIKRYPDQAGEEPIEIICTESMIADTKKINLSVNSMFYKAEKKDVWEIAQEFGDCEDLMLAKRQRLHKLGYPLGALRPVICRIRNGTGHAVLCLVTNQGDYILDNRFSLIVPWKRLQYSWLYRWAGKKWEILLND